MSDKHLVWMVGHSVSQHCCFNSSFVLFEEPVTQEQVEVHIGHTLHVDKRIGYRNLFETLDLSPEEETSILQSMRALFE